MRGLTATTTSTQPDLTTLFRLAAHETRKSRIQGRILRVVSGDWIPSVICQITSCFLVL